MLDLRRGSRLWRGGRGGGRGCAGVGSLEVRVSGGCGGA